jgi:cation:H+ antiporter
MASDLVLLGVSFVAIIVGAELLTHGVEWLGVRLNLSEGTEGSMLAAVGLQVSGNAAPSGKALTTW